MFRFHIDEHVQSELVELLSNRPAMFTACKHIKMISRTASNSVNCIQYFYQAPLRHSCLLCGPISQKANFHFTQTLKLTSRCKEAYVSSLHIFRAYSFSSSGGQHSHSLCLLDQIGEDRQTPWLSPRDGGKERERSVLSASVIGRGADTQCMWQGQSGVEGPPAILTLIWSSCGWEHETLNKTAAMDPLPSCQLALSVIAERKHTRIHKQTQTHTLDQAHLESWIGKGQCHSWEYWKV